MKLRVIVFQRIFSHYRKAFYDQLSEDFDFCLLHGSDKSGIHSEKGVYSRKVSQLNLFRDKARIYFSRRLLNGSSRIIVFDFAVQVVLLPLYILAAKLMGQKTLLWSHGYDRKKGFEPSKSLLDKYRKALIAASDGLLVYSERDRQYLIKKGISKPVYVVPNTLDSREIFNVKKRVLEFRPHADKKFIYNITFIGRLIESKNPTLLISLFDSLPINMKLNTSIHFIGEGPESVQISNALDGHPYAAHFVLEGAVYEENKIAALLLQTDLVVLPGEVGLSVNHALLYGVPVLAFARDENGPYHGPEEEHIQHFETGFWVEKDNLTEMRAYVIEYLSTPDLRERMRTIIDVYAKERLTIEQMTQGFNHAINSTVNQGYGR